MRIDCLGFFKLFPAAALLVIAAASPLGALAAAPAGATDFPSISRFKGSEITDYAVADFDEASLPVKAIDSDSPVPPDAVLKLEGKVTRISYAMPPNKTTLEVMRNYEQALSAAYKPVFKCAGDDCGRLMASYVGNSGKVMPSGWSAGFENSKNRYLLARKNDAAGDVYVLIYAMDNGNSNPVTVFQEVVEVKPMQTAQVVVIDAAAMKRGLDTEGRVALYGIYFDTAKAEVKAESKPSLDEMAKLLNADRALKVYIVGHTDNAGALASNIELSQHRADAVVKALATSYKIDAQRMVARGVASLAPVSSNADEAGRSRNRRVELVAQ